VIANTRECSPLTLSTSHALLARRYEELEAAQEGAKVQRDP